MEEKAHLKKTFVFTKCDLKVSLKVDHKIIKMVSRRVFCSTEKTLNSASVFFLPFAVSGTPGPPPIVQIPCKYHNFRDATLSQKKHTLLETGVKILPPATSKSTRNHKKMVLKTVEKNVFLSLLFCSLICWKMTSIFGRAGLNF